MISRMLLLLFMGLVFGQTKTVAVFDFKNDSLSINELITVMDRLRTEITQMSDFIVVDKDKINDVLKEQKIQTKNCFGECAIEVGKLLGAANVVCGSIGRISLTYTISAMVIDAQKGEIIRSIHYSAHGDNDSLLVSEMKEVALEIIIQEPQDTLIGAITDSTSFDKNSISDEPAITEPMATLWQLDAMKHWGMEKGINTKSFIKECYGLPIEHLTKRQGAEVLMFVQFDHMPGNW
tara:strand:- start:5731 stop:6438 length:708 start_codon:yes stop_codon:yes gene_type:complete